MKTLVCTLCIAFTLLFSSAKITGPQDGWISLFDGKSLNGWKVGDNAETFSV
ncbi:MAG TPA: hypothetical protein VHE59_20065 [Mucilaginibacter sp.]|nr:hypothetical protein [Mucilaginibacter sp.]